MKNERGNMNQIVEELSKKLVFDNLDPDGLPWDYPRADLILGNFQLGCYSQWLPESLSREGLPLNKPIHAWLNVISFKNGKYLPRKSEWFSCEKEAQEWLRNEVIRELSEIFQ